MIWQLVLRAMFHLVSWNSLLLESRNFHTYNTFKRHLKFSAYVTPRRSKIQRHSDDSELKQALKRNSNNNQFTPPSYMSQIRG